MASNEEMDRLRRALRTDGERVEIDRHVGNASADPRAASQSGLDASNANARGERVARVMDAEGRVYECGVDAAQVIELELLGARIL